MFGDHICRLKLWDYWVKGYEGLLCVLGTDPRASCLLNVSSITEVLPGLGVNFVTVLGMCSEWLSISTV
jgi:hypothetical protein